MRWKEPSPDPAPASRPLRAGWKRERSRSAPSRVCPGGFADIWTTRHGSRSSHRPAHPRSRAARARASRFRAGRTIGGARRRLTGRRFPSSGPCSPPRIRGRRQRRRRGGGGGFASDALSTRSTWTRRGWLRTSGARSRREPVSLAELVEQRLWSMDSRSSWRMSLAVDDKRGSDRRSPAADGDVVRSPARFSPGDDAAGGVHTLRVP